MAGRRWWICFASFLGLLPLVTAEPAKAPVAADKTGGVAVKGGPRDAMALAARIDDVLTAKQAADEIKQAPLADDHEFIRRIYLDLAGRIPSVHEIRAFIAET